MLDFIIFREPAILIIAVGNCDDCFRISSRLKLGPDEAIFPSAFLYISFNPL
jgi:hypothetical protein